MEPFGLPLERMRAPRAFDPYWVAHNLATYDIQVYARTMEPMFQVGYVYLDTGLATPATVGQPCAALRDQSGYARHVTQATLGNRPTVELATFPDGRQRPVLGYDGADWLQNLAPGALLRNVPGATLIVVYQTTAPGTAQYPIYVLNSAVGRLSVSRERYTARQLNVTGRRLDTDPVQEINSAGGIFTSGEWGVQCVRVDYANSNAWLHYQSNIVGSTMSWSTDGNTSDTDSLGFFLGAANSSGAVAITGQIAEFCVLGACITECLMLRYLREYVRPYWGLTTIT